MANTFDASELQIVKQLTEELKKLRTEFRGIVTDVKKAQTEMGKQSKAQSDVSDKAGKVESAQQKLSAIERERIALLNKLNRANSDSIQRNEELKLQVQKQSKANKDLAREKLGLIGAYERETKKLKELQTQYKNTVVQYGKNSKEAKALEGQINKLNQKIQGANDGARSGARRFGEWGTSLGSIPGPIGGVVAGIQRMTQAAIKFIATPLGAVLALIVGAILAVKAAFTSSEEGQNKFARIMAVISTILGNLLDVLADVGEALIWAVEHPKEAWQGFKDFVQGIGEFFQNTFINIIGGTVTAVTASLQANFAQIGLAWQKLKGIFTDNTEAVKEAEAKIEAYQKKFIEGANRTIEGASNLKESVVGAYDNMKGAVGDFIEQNIEEAKSAQKVADMRANAEKLERELIIKRAKLESQIAELRLKAREEDQYTAEQRRDFLIEARKLQDGLLEQETKVLVLRRDAQILENTFSRTNIENKRKEAEAIAEVSRKEAERFNQARQVQRELIRIDNEIARERTKQFNEDLKFVSDQTALVTDEIDQIVSSGEINVTDIAKQESDARLKIYEDEAAERAKIKAAEQETLKQIESAATTILSDQFNASIDNDLNNYIESNQAKQESLKTQLENGKIDEAEYERQIKQLRQKARAEEARAEKKKALFQIGLDVLKGVAKAIAESPITFGLPFSAYVVAQGAIQAAAVAARPIPKFGYGSGGALSSDTFAQIGDRYQHELVTMPDGSIFFSDNKPQNVLLPAGAEVFSGEKTKQIAQNNGYDSFLMKQLLIGQKEQTKQIKRIASRNRTDKGIIEEGNNYINRYVK